jgi:hypothetical protein
MTKHRDPEVLVTAGFVLVTRSTGGVRRTNSFIHPSLAKRRTT